MIAHALCVLALGAGPQLTLDEALAEADQAHADIQLARVQRAQAGQDERLAYSPIYPRVDGFASASGSYSAAQTTYNTYPVTSADGSIQEFKVSQVDIPGYGRPDFQLGLRVTQTLYDGGKWWTTIDKGHNDAALAEAQLQEARLQAHLQVAHTFFEVVRGSQALEVLQTNVARSEEQVRRAEALFEAGKGAKSDILAAKVNLANDQIAVVQQQARLDLARSGLNSVLGREERGALEAVAPPLTPPPSVADRAALTSQGEAHRPGLEALRKSVDSATLGSRIARSDYFPNLSLVGTYVRDSPNPLLVVGNPTRQFVAQAQLQLGWNLFAGHATEIAVQKAELAGDTARANLVKAQRAVRDEIERAARSVESTGQAAQLAELAKSTADQGLALAEERFRAGAGSNLEVRDAQLKVAQADLSVLSTRIDLQLAAVDLRAALGEL